MEDKIQLKNNLKEIRIEKKMSQGALAKAVGVSRNTISSIETGQYCPTAKLAYSLCILLDKKFEDVFYFEGLAAPAVIECESAVVTEEREDSLSDAKIQKIFNYLSNEGWAASKILDFIVSLTK